MNLLISWMDTYTGITRNGSRYRSGRWVRWNVGEVWVWLLKKSKKTSAPPWLAKNYLAMPDDQEESSKSISTDRLTQAVPSVCYYLSFAFRRICWQLEKNAEIKPVQVAFSNPNRFMYSYSIPNSTFEPSCKLTPNLSITGSATPPGAFNFFSYSSSYVFEMSFRVFTSNEVSSKPLYNRD